MVQPRRASPFLPCSRRFIDLLFIVLGSTDPSKGSPRPVGPVGQVRLPTGFFNAPAMAIKRQLARRYLTISSIRPKHFTLSLPLKIRQKEYHTHIPSIPEFTRFFSLSGLPAHHHEHLPISVPHTHMQTQGQIGRYSRPVDRSRHSREPTDGTSRAPRSQTRLVRLHQRGGPHPSISLVNTTQSLTPHPHNPGTLLQKGESAPRKKLFSPGVKNRDDAGAAPWFVRRCFAIFQSKQRNNATTGPRHDPAPHCAPHHPPVLFSSLPPGTGLLQKGAAIYKLTKR